MNKEKVISSIVYEGKFQLKPSKVCDGVGVFTLIDIPTNTMLFNDIQPDNNFIQWSELPEIGSSVKEYINSICNSTEEGFYLSRTINQVCIPYYINHSEEPNVKHYINEDVYVTSRLVKAGEELLCRYKPEEINW